MVCVLNLQPLFKLNDIINREIVELIVRLTVLLVKILILLFVKYRRILYWFRMVFTRKKKKKNFSFYTVYNSGSQTIYFEPPAQSSCEPGPLHLIIACIHYRSVAIDILQSIFIWLSSAHSTHTLMFNRFFKKFRFPNFLSLS